MVRIAARRARKAFKKCDHCGKSMVAPKDGMFDRWCFGCKCSEHDPDQDDPTTCFLCQWPIPRDEQVVEAVCPSCDGTGVWEAKRKDLREVAEARKDERERVLADIERIGAALDAKEDYAGATALYEAAAALRAVPLAPVRGGGAK